MSKKKNKTKNKGSIFFAYQSIEKSGTCDNVDAINGLAKYLGNKAITWEKMKTNGKLINRQILDEIDKAEIFACDITYQNPNVYFELGYAIGKRKPLFLMINPKVKEAIRDFQNISILKGIGYSEFNNSDDLRRKLDDLDMDSVLFDQLDILKNPVYNYIDIFYIKSRANSQAELETISFIKDSEYSQICDDKSEIPYQPLEWYLESLNRSKNLIIHLSSDDKTTSEVDNCINSLYAGLGYALRKRVLFVAPKPYYAPIDYNDILIEYKSAEECVRRIKDWLPPKNKKTKIVEDKELNLIKLGIGYSIAEDEKDALLSYFVETVAYNKALRSRSSIFYGRKGTGKTALYIKLFNEYKEQDNTYILGLKPESTDLMDNVEAIELFRGSVNKKSILHSIWKYVLYSKLLISLYDKILQLERYVYTNTEQKVLNYYDENKEILNLNFLGLIKLLFGETSKYSLALTEVIEKYNKQFLSELIKTVKEYFHNNKYFKIAIIADNLDKAWDSNSDLSLQADMILSLLEVSGKFSNDILDKKDKIIDTTLIMFLRSDIYKFILDNSREPDKITINSHEVEWKSCRELLKRVVEKRICHVLELKEDEIPSIWKSYFDFGRETPFNLVQNVCLSRPRDILFFFAKMFESACNNSRTKVNRNDYDYALDIYTNFLYQNLVAEMNAEYPYIRRMIGELHSKFTGNIDIDRFRKIVSGYEKDSKKSKQLISELFSNEYLIATNNTDSEIFSNYDDILDAEEISSKRIIFSKKHFYISLHPRYARMKM